MKQQCSRWITGFLTVSVLGTTLCCAPRTAAAASGDDQPALAGPSQDDLSMFWDDKELYVQTATRSDKPINQVAENMTVITAKEIKVMNANSVAEVLARVPGLFVNFQGQDYNSTSLLRIQGSEERHVTVLLDGMPVNYLSGGSAETAFIPIRIVERIEIIKGAASSSWGSALGGVVNIITRDTGDNTTPDGMLSASYGEANSRNTDGELRGSNGPLGYYLYAGQQASDGLRNRRDSSRASVFAKLLLTPTRDLDITISGGFSDPQINSGDLGGVQANVQMRNRFLNGSVEYRATPELTVRGGLHLFNTYIDIPTHTLPDNALLVQNINQEQTIGGNLRATWTSGVQTLTVGGEASHGALDETTNTGPIFQSPAYQAIGYGRPPSETVSPTIDRWGLFANDTLELGPFAVTPGIRLDHDNISGSFVSPSLGVTWELGEHTVARASAARGFTSPPLDYAKGQSLYSRSNPDIKDEYGWSYQAGLESGLADLVNLKGTLFRHETTKAISVESIPGQAPYRTVYNRGDATRQGYELEAETVPYYNLSLRLGHAYSHFKGETVSSGYANPYYDSYSWLLGVKYDDRRSFSALLSGSYVFWDTSPADQGRYTTFIWDLTATKRFQTSDTTILETFLTVHNIFSGAYYMSSIYPNAGRWVEGGLRFKF